MESKVSLIVLSYLKSLVMREIRDEVGISVRVPTSKNV